LCVNLNAFCSRFEITAARSCRSPSMLATRSTDTTAKWRPRA
jgi:hypothetical protein